MYRVSNEIEKNQAVSGLANKDGVPIVKCDKLAVEVIKTAVKCT